MTAAGAGRLENIADALHAEAVAMIYAIKYATELGMDSVVFEADSLIL